MKQLCAAVLLLICVLTLCLWTAHEAELSCSRMIRDLERADDAVTLAELYASWEKEKKAVCLSVNRSLLSEIDRELTSLQASLPDRSLFECRKAELLATLQTVQSSYGICFSSIL